MIFTIVKIMLGLHIDGNRKSSIAYAINSEFYLDCTDKQDEGIFTTDYKDQSLVNDDWQAWTWAPRFVDLFVKFL